MAIVCRKDEFASLSVFFPSPLFAFLFLPNNNVNKVLFDFREMAGLLYMYTGVVGLFGYFFVS